MERHFKNIAFISYSHKNVKVAKRLHRKLIVYRVPNRIKKEYPDIPTRIRKVFRDQDELTPGHTTLSDQIKQQLADSKYLVVICTPESKASRWVNLEIDYYIKTLNRGNYIIPYIPMSEADMQGKDLDSALPEALTSNLNLDEVLCVDEKENGKQHAFVKLVAGLLDVQFSELWDINVRLARRKRWLYSFLSACVVGIVLLTGAYITRLRRHSVYEQKVRYASQSLEALREGNLISAERLALKSAEGKTVIPEAEMALRTVYDSLIADFGGRYKLIFTKSYQEKPQAVLFAPDALHFLVVIYGSRVEFIDTDTYEPFHELNLQFTPEKMSCSFNGRLLYFYRDDALCIYDTQSKSIIFGPYQVDNQRIIGVNDYFTIMQDPDNVIRFYDTQGRQVRDRIRCSFRTREAVMSIRHQHIAFFSSESPHSDFSIYDLQNGEILLQQNDSTKYINQLAFSPHNDYFYVLQGDRFDLYHYYRGKYYHGTRREFNHGGKYVYYSDAVPVSENHDFIAIDDNILVRDSNFGQREKLASHNKDILDLSFSQDGNIIATTGEDNQLKIWRKSPVFSRLSEGLFTIVTIQKDQGNTEAFMVKPLYGSDLIFLCDSRTGEATAMREESHYNTPVFANDGSHVLIPDRFNNLIRLWDYKTGKTRSVACKLPSDWIIPSPDGTRFICEALDSVYVFKWENRMRDISHSSFNPSTKYIEQITFGSDGNEIGILGSDIVKVFDDRGNEVLSFDFEKRFDMWVHSSHLNEKPYHQQLFFSPESVFFLLNRAICKIDRQTKATTLLHGEFDRFEYDFNHNTGVASIGNRIFLLDSNLNPRLIGLSQAGTTSFSDTINGLTILDDSTVVSATDIIQFWNTQHSMIPHIGAAPNIIVWDNYVDFDKGLKSDESWPLPDSHRLITQYELSPEMSKVVLASTGGLYLVSADGGELLSGYDGNALYGTFYKDETALFAKYQDTNVYHLEGDDRVSVFCDVGKQPNCLRYLHHRGVLLVGTEVGLLIYNNEGSFVRGVYTSAPVVHISNSKLDNRFAVCLSNGDVVVFDQQWHVITTYTGTAGESDESVFIDDERLAIKENERTLVIYHIDNKRIINRYPFAFSRNPSLTYYEKEEMITSDSVLSYPPVSSIIHYLRQDCSARDRTKGN